VWLQNNVELLWNGLSVFLWKMAVVEVLISMFAVLENAAVSIDDAEQRRTAVEPAIKGVTDSG